MLLDIITNHGLVQALLIISLTLIVIVPWCWRLADRSSQQSHERKAQEDQADHIRRLEVQRLKQIEEGRLIETRSSED